MDREGREGWREGLEEPRDRSRAGSQRPRETSGCFMISVWLKMGEHHLHLHIGCLVSRATSDSCD